MSGSCDRCGELLPGRARLCEVCRWLERERKSSELRYNVPCGEGAGYAPDVAEAVEAGRVDRLWRLGNRIVSVRLTKREGGGIWKSVHRFPVHEPDALLPQLARIGVHHPSSYASCYHQLAPRLRIVPYSYSGGMFDWWRGGPWEEAPVRPGSVLGGPWWRYDLTSAYRWAASLELPDPSTYIGMTVRRESAPGLWLCELLDWKDRARLPECYREKKIIVMSSEEIDGYRVRVRIHRGVTWTRTMGPMWVEHTLGKLPCGKQAGRSFWGRWAPRDRLTCWTPAREWTLPNRDANYIWAWLVTGRVRLKLWAVAGRACHIYVDELTVPHELPTGTAPGDFHLKQRYPFGVWVEGVGNFGPMLRNGKRGRPHMWTGMPHALRLDHTLECPTLGPGASPVDLRPAGRLS